MSKLPLPQAIQRIQENDDRMDRFANGGDTETFTTSGGVVIPSFAKFVKDHDAQLVAFPALIESASGAANVGTTPAGNISSTNVQAAINELDSEKIQSSILSAPDGASHVGIDVDTVLSYFKDKVNRVVDSISALRSVDKTKFTKVFVTGYYAPYDQGGGNYRYDSTDTTSVDNGGSIIVATDGGRWKLCQSGSLTSRQFGLKGDGSDETAIAQKFFNAIAGKRGIHNAGICVVTNLQIASNTTLEGEGFDVSGFKRKNSATGNASILDISGVTGVTIREISFDGNKANQTNAGSNVFIGNSDNIHLFKCKFVNAKSVSGGFGNGVVIQDGTGQTNKRKIILNRCVASGNDGADIFGKTTWYIEISKCFLKGSGGGINIMNFVFPPVAEVQNFIDVLDNVILDQTGSGVAFSGYVESGTSSANAKLGPNVPPQRYCKVRGNSIANCTLYGIAFQGSNTSITGNDIYQCGSVSGGGGVLLNAYGCSFSGANNIRDCWHYGIDAGGCYSCDISNNVFTGIAATFNSSGTDINIGAGYNNVVSNNIIDQIGSHMMVAIQSSGVESDGTAPFPLQGGAALGTIIEGNKISLNSNVNSAGVRLFNNQERVTVQNNHVRGAQPNRAYLLEATGIIAMNNVDERSYANGSPIMGTDSASTLIIPDVGNVFFVGGTTNITSIRSFSSNTYNGKIRSCQAQTHGSGYSRTTPPTVTFSGGGGTGLAATALVSYDGQLISWNVTNNGTGYTSAPTPTITHNGGSGGNCVPILGCNNSEGREITLFFTGALTVTNGGNLILNGNYTTTANVSMLRLLGVFDSWYEISRR